MNAPEGSAPVNAPAAEATQSTPLPSLPMRVVQVFFSPGKLAEALAEHPVWAATFVLGIVLVIAQTLLIPGEVWQTMVREQMLARGQDPSVLKGGASSLFRVFGLVGGLVGVPLITFVTAGLTTVVFAFVLGDEGRFKQYLSVTSHALLVAFVVGLALVPLKIIQGDPRTTLNVGTFFFFVKSGYLYRWLKMMDLSNLWSWLVIAQGAACIDKRRTFGSAATVVVVIFLIFTALFALLPSAA